MTTSPAPIPGAAFERGWVALESVGAAMMVCDAQRRLVAASPTARNLFVRAGIALSEAPQPLPETLWIALNAAVSDQALWRVPGGRCLIGVSRYALGSAHSLLVMREIAERRAVEVHEHQRELARRLHEQRLEVTGRLVVTLAHDLRNPLASILLNVEALRAPALNLDAESGAALDDIHNAVDRVRRAIDALVEFGRQGPPALSEVPLEDVVARVVGALRPALREGGHQLHVGLAGLAVSANPLLLEQIVANLVMNAIQSQVQPVTVTLRAERDGASVLLAVQDDGPGIAPDVLERVFEPFYTTRPGQIGLGLTIAREAAHSLGGEIVAESSPDGTRMLLTLPAARPR